MALRLYDTMSREVRDVFAMDGESVRFYCCGPTVYGPAHVGNFRTFVLQDVFRRTLETSGLKTYHARNLTDVDDKTIRESQAEGVSLGEFTDRWTKRFEQDCGELNLLRPHIQPSAVGHVPEQIALIERLIEGGKAYQAPDKSVYFKVDAFEDYGSLSRLADRQITTSSADRESSDEYDRDSAADFALWKARRPEDGENYWESPWGQGRPGWHIECSAICLKHLGESFDLHSGGVDLVFPHHENEIAQGEGRTGKCYCNQWMHNNFLNLNDEKMSKSLGNIITARGFMEKYNPEVLKYLMLSSHYRALFNLNNDKISQVLTGLSRIYVSMRDAFTIFAGEDVSEKPDAHLVKLTQEADKKITESLNDDFNSPEVIAHIFEVVRSFNSMNLINKKRNGINKATSKHFYEWVNGAGKIMALFQEDPTTLLSELDDILIREKNIDVLKVESLMDERKKARDEKNFSRADEIRDELTRMGIMIMDGVEGRGWELDKR